MTPLPNGYAAVIVPEGTCSVSQTHIFAGEDPIAFHDYDGAIISAFNRPGYELIGLAKELSEEQWAEIVEGNGLWYKCYHNTIQVFPSPTESATSLLASLSLPANCLILKQK